MNVDKSFSFRYNIVNLFNLELVGYVRSFVSLYIIPSHVLSFSLSLYPFDFSN